LSVNRLVAIAIDLIFEINFKRVMTKKINNDDFFYSMRSVICNIQMTKLINHKTYQLFAIS
jgi:hypothetical protein